MQGGFAQPAPCAAGLSHSPEGQRPGLHWEHGWVSRQGDSRDVVTFTSIYAQVYSREAALDVDGAEGPAPSPSCSGTVDVKLMALGALRCLTALKVLQRLGHPSKVSLAPFTLWATEQDLQSPERESKSMSMSTARTDPRE